MKLLLSLYIVAHLAIVFASSEDNDLIYVERSKVTFRLFTRDLKNYTNIVYGNVQNAPVVKDKAFKFIIHGYTQNADVLWMNTMKDAYLKKDNYNVVLVDWKEPAGSIWYPNSARNTKEVGTFLGELLVELNSVHGIPFENIHLIGHSLGGHVSSFAAKFLKATKGAILGRITGMDPAGPYFWLAKPEDRLNASDAKFVDVIHTDLRKFGYNKRIGQVDFYPNGGFAPQPGCWMREPGDLIVACSHMRVLTLFEESINSDGFIARECGSISEYRKGYCNKNPSAVMGENASAGVTGNYYLTTNKYSPYARNGNI